MCIVIPLRTLRMSGRCWSLSCSISVLNADKDLLRAWLFFREKSHHARSGAPRAERLLFQCPAGNLMQDLEAELWLRHSGVSALQVGPRHRFVPLCARRAMVLFQESRTSNTGKPEQSRAAQASDKAPRAVSQEGRADQNPPCLLKAEQLLPKA